MTRLSFTPAGHVYRLTPPDGGRPEKIPSVTGLLKMLDKPALTKWAANTAADYATDHWAELDGMSPSARRKAISSAPWSERGRAAAKGTVIHAMAEQLLHGQPVQVPPEVSGKVQALARWLEATGLMVDLTEAAVWSDHDPDLGLTAYAGKVDAIVKHPQRGLGLVDFKTGSGIYSETALQLAGYAGADWLVVDDQDTVPTRYDWLGAVHIQPDTVDLHVLTADQWAGAGQRFELLRMLACVPEPVFQLQVGA